MRPIDDSFFYELAKRLSPLRELKPDRKLNDVIFQVYDAERWLDYLLQDKIVPLSVCKNVGTRLLLALREVTAVLAQEKSDFTKPVGSEAYDITSSLNEFEVVLTAELATLDTYFISQTGIFSTRDLIERAEKAFPESARKTIPDHAVKDIRQAGKCLAFELPTAAAFHMLRAAESLIRAYYEIVVGHLPKMQSRNWGRYIRHLRTHGADPKILSALEQIRDMHRNPVIHPEEFLSNEEALTLFGVAQGIIVSIAADIERRKQPTLPNAFGSVAAILGLGPKLKD